MPTLLSGLGICRIAQFGENILNHARPSYHDCTEEFQYGSFDPVLFQFSNSFLTLNFASEKLTVNCGTDAIIC